MVDAGCALSCLLGGAMSSSGGWPAAFAAEAESETQSWAGYKSAFEVHSSSSEIIATVLDAPSVNSFLNRVPKEDKRGKNNGFSA